MISEGTEVVAATGAVPDSVVFGAAGSAKLFHAVGQHGLQVLLGLALLLQVTGASRRRALTVVLTASAGYVLVLAGVGAAALRGEAWLSLPAVAAAARGPGRAAAGRRRARRPSPGSTGGRGARPGRRAVVG